MKKIKNRIVLLNFLPSVNASFSKRGAVHPSNAVLLISTILKENGYTVEIIDGGYHEDYLTHLIKYLKEYHNEIVFVGMSVMTAQVPMAIRASVAIKKHFEKIPVIWGGVHPTLFPYQTLENKNIDIVVINEGAKTSIEIANIIQLGEDLSKINGIGYKNKQDKIIINTERLPEDIRDLPFFDFSLINIDNYLNVERSSYQREYPKFKGRIKPLPILTGLGCPYKCQFCINVILKRRYRFRSAESIVTEIKRLQSKYATNTFIFMDEDFFINKRRVLEFISYVERDDLHFNWRMWCRVDHFSDDYINRELIERLNKIGHGSLVMGGESGNQGILDQIKKGITTDQILNSLKILKGTHINARYSFIVGFENEGLDQIKNTFKFCLKMKKIKSDVDIAGPFLFRLYPGSPIYDRITKKYGIETPAKIEEWEKFLAKNEAAFSSMPWTPKIFQKNLEFIPFYSQQAMRIPKRIDNIEDLSRYVLGKCSEFRIKTFFFYFPFEYWIASNVMRVI